MSTGSVIEDLAERKLEQRGKKREEGATPQLQPNFPHGHSKPDPWPFQLRSDPRSPVHRLINVIHVLQHQSLAFCLITAKSEVTMATSSLKRNEKKRNKYVVNAVPSSSYNQRLLVFLLTAVALVTLAILLGILIPVYMTGSGDEENIGK